MYVNVYLIDKAYGGPEEGGWWYEFGEIINVYPVSNERTAKRLKSRLENGTYSNEERVSIDSVLSEGEYSVVIEHSPGISWPQRKPYYS